jgi:hypothetical protein
VTQAQRASTSTQRALVIGQAIVRLTLARGTVATIAP